MELSKKSFEKMLKNCSFSCKNVSNIKNSYKYCSSMLKIDLE